MKTATTLISLLLCILFSACSKENSPEDSIEYAPVSIQGKNMRLCTSSNIDSWFIDTIIESNNSVLITPHDKSWNIENTYATYNRTDKNTAKYILEYTINIDDTKVEHHLEVTLTFNSQNEGTYSGKDEILSGDIERTNNVSGYFIFDIINTPTDPDDGQEGEVNISAPIIEDVTASSALIKGTILGNKEIIKERGICYSTHSLPTIDDNINKVNTDVINITLSNLNNATKYYARFYAKVREEIKYGEESFFQTLGVSTSNILLTLTGISTYTISLKAKISNTISTFGLCYSTSPKPQITDSYIDEAFKKEEWIISPISQNETYYIRAYHIDGNKIIYYDDSQIAVETLGKSIKIENVITYSEKSEQQRYIAPITYKYTEYKNPILRVSYSGLPKGTYETTITIEKAWYVDSYEGKFKSYIDKSSGQMEYSISKSWSNHQKINTYLKCIETGIEYQNSNYGYEQRIN